MAKDDWYRRTTWSEHDREEFNARLSRARSAYNKASYLGVQAQHLAGAGLHSHAIELIDRLLAEYPEPFFSGTAHLLRAKSLGSLGQTDAAIAEFRAALQAQREYPNVRTTADLDFAWFVIRHDLTHLFAEVLQVLEEFRDETLLKFASNEYRYWAVRAFIAEHQGDRAAASACAQRALAEAERKHSGLRYHANVGLVGTQPVELERRLKGLAKATESPWWKFW